MAHFSSLKDVLQSEDMPWPIAAALVASFAISVGVPLWLWTYKRRARQAEKEKKKAVNAENKARIVEQVCCQPLLLSFGRY